MTPVLLSLGSNLDPERHLREGVAALRARFGEVTVSPFYRMPAVGFDGPDFLNAGALLHTDLAPRALDDWLHALEDRHGRDRSGPRFGDRTLDIDIVYYGAKVSAAGERPRVPRPELAHAFVLMPLAKIAPDFVDPVQGRTLRDLWRAHPQHGTAFERVSASGSPSRP